MSFQPNPNDELTIGGDAYRVAEHPAAPGIAHGQEGRAGIVYRLVALTSPPAPSPLPPGGRGEGGAAGGGGGRGEGSAALKVFKPRFRLPFLVSQAEKLAAYAELPGLAACRRTVLTPSRDADPHLHADTHFNPDNHANAHSNLYGHADPHLYRHVPAHGNPYPHRHAHSHADSHLHADTHSNPDSHATRLDK